MPPEECTNEVPPQIELPAEVDVPHDDKPHDDVIEVSPQNVLPTYGGTEAQPEDGTDADQPPPRKVRRVQAKPKNTHPVVKHKTRNRLRSVNLDDYMVFVRDKLNHNLSCIPQAMFNLYCVRNSLVAPYAHSRVRCSEDAMQKTLERLKNELGKRPDPYIFVSTGDVHFEGVIFCREQNKYAFLSSKQDSEGVINLKVDLCKVFVRKTFGWEVDLYTDMEVCCTAQGGERSQDCGWYTCIF